MNLRLGCIADDYTGASDLANTLTRQGLRTIQTIGVPAPSLALPDVDAVVIALKSRSIAADAAIAKSLAAATWLRDHGAAHIMFKICSTFDSTDAGNIGPVTEALAKSLKTPIVAVTPAFPETGRTIFQGHLFVGRQLLAESPLKDHPLNPMRQSDLTRVLARQSTGKIGLVPFDVVAQGGAAITAHLTALQHSGCTAAIIDAIAERDLVAIGEAIFPTGLSTGASGLGLGLARAAISNRPPEPAPLWPPTPGRAAIIAGSCSAATIEQIAAIADAIPTRHLDIDQLLDNGPERPAALAWAIDHLPRGPILLASSADPATVARLQATHGPDAGARIESELAELAASLIAAGVDKLIVAGGETSGAIVDRLGVTALAIGAEIAPGVPLVRSIAGKPILFALKSGNFGGPDFFRRALAAMGATRPERNGSHGLT